MQKIMVLVALGVVLGWFGITQFERVETDSAVASVNRNVTNTAVHLPSLATPIPGMDMMVSAVAADSAQQHSSVHP
jgi:hypothetical protein